MHPSITYKEGVISVDSLESDINYYICPNHDCEGFFSEKDLCDRDCPWESHQRIVIKCWSCGKTIVLPGDHCSWCRVDCECGAANFQRMSGKSRLVFWMTGPKRKPRKTFAENRCGVTWEKCNHHFGCKLGEECWYDSDDYYYDCGEGSYCAALIP